LQTGGVDRLVRSIRINGAVGSVNAPTVFNSGFNFKQFWEGRADTLEDQIDGPLNAPDEMGSAWEDVISKLKRSSDYDYVSAFGDLYPDGIQINNIKDAIAAFERSLLAEEAIPLQPSVPVNPILNERGAETSNHYRIFDSQGDFYGNTRYQSIYARNTTKTTRQRHKNYQPH
jgi:hypothetical protein